MQEDVDLRMNYLGVNKLAAINSYGEYFKVGDTVEHDGADDTAIITSFEFDEKQEEVKAHTTKGYCHIDFIGKIEV